MPLWLDRINCYRGLAGVPLVTEDPNLSAGDLAAATYIVHVGPPLSHNEDPSTPYYIDTQTTPITPGPQNPNPYYSDAGKAAAQSSDLYAYSNQLPPEDQIVDGWMTGAFHGPNMLDPRLRTVGFSTYQDLQSPSGFQGAAALNIISGMDLTASGFPVYWPPNGGRVSLTTYNTNEEPDARTVCAGFAGLPISLQLGLGNVQSSTIPGTSGVTSYAFTQNGMPLTVCEIDEFNYTNPNSIWQQTGQQVLHGQGTVVLLPQPPLTVGANYTASITVNGQAYTWSFTVDTSLAPTITGLSPNSGQAGSTRVTITGSGFRGTSAVNFGSLPASSFTVVSDTQITAVCPATGSGTVDVTVVTPCGTSTTGAADQFTYNGTLNGTLHFLALDTSGGLSYAGYPASGGSWPLSFSQISAQKSTDNTPLQLTEIAGAMVGTELHICGLDNTGAIWHSIYSATGPLSFDLVSAQSPGNQAYTKLSCAGTPAGSLHICALDANGVIYHDVHTATSPSWSLTFADNVNQLCNGATLSFLYLACTTTQEDLHICALAQNHRDAISFVANHIDYTRCTVANGTSTWQTQFVDYPGWPAPPSPLPHHVVPADSSLVMVGLGCAALSGTLHAYPMGLYAPPIVMGHTSIDVTAANGTWQPLTQDSVQRPQLDLVKIPYVSCTNWNNTIHISYGFSSTPTTQVPGSSTPAIMGTQTFYHTTYSPGAGGWSSSTDTVLTQDRTGSYFLKVSIVGE